jgi:hypothetical protein
MGGMFLLIHPNCSKYWRFRFRFGGKQHLMVFTLKLHWLMLVKKEKRPEGLLLLESILANTNVL